MIQKLKPQAKSALAIFIVYVGFYSVGVFYWKRDVLALALIIGFLKGI